MKINRKIKLKSENNIKKPIKFWQTSTIKGKLRQGRIRDCTHTGSFL